MYQRTSPELIALLATRKVVPKILGVTSKEHPAYAWERKEPTRIRRTLVAQPLWSNCIAVGLGLGAQWGRVDQMCLGPEPSWHSEVAMQYPSFLASLLASSKVTLCVVLGFPAVLSCSR